ncbi:MAG: thioredoxin [Elusimicrobiota bacterium]
MEDLTKETFKAKVFDYENGKEWKFAGDLPCVVDFYADWCGPCRTLAPVLQEIADEHAGKVDVYKVNTEDQQELASVFGISSIPTLLFIPKDGKPRMALGSLPKKIIEKGIREVLGIEA